MSRDLNICVIGAGVSGLSVAALLLKSGHSVTIAAESIGEGDKLITSAAAAAFWYPFWVGDDPNEMHSWYDQEWALDTFLELENLLSEKSGISRITLREFFPSELDQDTIDEIIDLMWWRNVPKMSFQSFDPSTKNRSSWKFRAGITFETLVINMRTYLPFLRDYIASFGQRAIMSKQTFESIPETLFRTFDFVINCSAAGSHGLVGDQGIKNVEGLVVRLEPSDSIHEITLVHTGAEFSDTPLYVVPRKGAEPDIIVGGTVDPDQQGHPRYLDWATLDQRSREAKIATRTLERNISMVPELRACKPLAVVVGYRPRRVPKVRLGIDWNFPQLIHNYGHAGAGVTLSWGCARQVVAWVNRLAAGGISADIPYIS